VSWIPVTLEFTHQLIVACWTGSLVGLGFVVVPGLYGTLRDPNEAAWSVLDLIMRLDFMAGGAGAFLLLTTLLMYVLALRTSRATLTQTGILMAMTAAAVTNHVVVAPKMAELLRAAPDLLTGTDLAARGRFDELTRIGMGLLGLQIALGASLLFLGVRRWYRYVTPTRSPRLSLIGE
jgi:putative copper export protein